MKPHAKGQTCSGAYKEPGICKAIRQPRICNAAVKVTIILGPDWLKKENDT